MKVDGFMSQWYRRKHKRGECFGRLSSLRTSACDFDQALGLWEDIEENTGLQNNGVKTSVRHNWIIPDE